MRPVVAGFSSEAVATSLIQVSGRGGDPEEERHTVHGQATHIPQDRSDLRGEGLATRGGAGKRIATLLAPLVRFPDRSALVHEPLTLALETDTPHHPPSQR